MSVYAMKSDMILENDGSHILNINEFSFEGTYYKPSDPVKFLITEEPEGWMFIRDDSIGIRSGGDYLEVAIMEGLFVISDRYHKIISTPDEKLNEDMICIKKKFLSWEVHAIDQQAQ